MPPLLIHKLDIHGQETFQYAATRVLTRTATTLVVEAFFERQDRLDLGYTVFERGDRFVEYFYSDRWYNVFDIYGVQSGVRRGWYCNIARPALITDLAVHQVDLALDIWVNPDGTTQLLDEEEFIALPLETEERTAAWAAVEAIYTLIRQQTSPFTRLHPPAIA